MIDGLRVVVECCNEEVQLAIIVVISPIQTHTAVDVAGGVSNGLLHAA